MFCRITDKRVVHESGFEHNTFWISAGIHGNAWDGILGVLYSMNNLVEKWDTLPVHIRNIDWYILPVMNPDGFEYSHTPGNRQWSKNRSTTPEAPDCIGVDLNRNFDHYWGLSTGDDGDRTPSGNNYPGPAVSSEMETKAVVAFINKFAEDYFDYFITFDSGSKTISYPLAFP